MDRSLKPTFGYLSDLGECLGDHAPTEIRRVARSVGYESDAAFSKAFKRVVGANPGEYLKRGFEGHSNAGMAEDF
jgi:AraC-like DNA-binding protein